MEIEKKLQNTQNSEKYYDVHGVHYNPDPVDAIAVGIEGYDVMNDNLEQINIIILLLHVFGYNIVNNRFEKETNLKFEFKNKNVNCGNFLVLFLGALTMILDLAGFYLAVIYFTIMQSIDELPLEITLLIEFYTIIVAFIQIMLNFGTPSSAVFCYKHVIHNVCHI